MKVMIVDDEAIERQVLKRILEKEIPGIIVNGEARNGRIAIEIAEEFKPDIIFMDIKMPGMNGIEAIKEIQQSLPKSKFIMITAFDTFEYAREVMQKGVREYLLKPAKKQDVLDAYYRMEEAIKREIEEREKRDNVKKEYDKVLAISQKEWIASSIMDHVLEISFEDWSDLLGLRVNTGQMVVFSFNDTIGKQQRQFYYNWLKQTIKRGSELFFVGPMIGEKIPVLFLCESRIGKERQVKAVTIQNVRNFIHQFYTAQEKRTGIKAGIGKPFFIESDFSSSYNEALVALGQVRDQEGPPYQYGVVGQKEIANQFPLDREKLIMDGVRNGNEQEALTAFEVYIFELKGEGFSLLELHQKMEDFMIVLRHTLKELGIDSKRRFQSTGITGNEELIVLCKEYIQYLIMEIMNWRMAHSQYSLIEVKDYIKENYDKNLTLEGVAEQLGLSPFYFSKLFKEKFQITFIHYLTDVRMNKAKDMLLQRDQSVKEVCFLVGYKDPNYFSRVFKKNTTFTPKEFKEKAMQKQE
ncbi:hypothetical protein CR203_20920 [Salipaludibacillus neizhouensis]|uniref:DNA-binding response regulator n=1 Tax=Salipaludibacillus neizhouensis TaxID=885475 RepID=A0A3A9K4Z8_9BACI|nr:response regulator [Salipaludibacillus neizhouensis]RKL65411.1 hypothetical protein CR203_20920 [Salipaludibacillus neizhouensis]